MTRIYDEDDPTQRPDIEETPIAPDEKEIPEYDEPEERPDQEEEY